MLSIKNLPKHERPREKLIEKGPTALKDKELLAILLRTGREGKSAVEIAHEILRRYKMKKLVHLGFNELAKIKGIGPAKACQILAALRCSRLLKYIIMVKYY